MLNKSRFLLLCKTSKCAKMGIQCLYELIVARGVQPKCLSLDKETSEWLEAVHIMPNTAIQLCLFHVKKAIKSRSSISDPVQGFRWSEMEYAKEMWRMGLNLPKFGDQRFPLPKLIKEELQLMIKTHARLNAMIPIHNLYVKHLRMLLLRDLSMFIENNSLHKDILIYLWSEWYCRERYLLWTNPHL